MVNYPPGLHSWLELATLSSIWVLLHCMKTLLIPLGVILFFQETHRWFLDQILSSVLLTFQGRNWIAWCIPWQLQWEIPVGTDTTSGIIRETHFKEKQPNLSRAASKKEWWSLARGFSRNSPRENCQNWKNNMDRNNSPRGCSFAVLHYSFISHTITLWGLFNRRSHICSWNIKQIWIILGWDSSFLISATSKFRSQNFLQRRTGISSGHLFLY